MTALSLQKIQINCFIFKNYPGGWKFTNQSDCFSCTQPEFRVSPAQPGTEGVEPMGKAGGIQCVVMSDYRTPSPGRHTGREGVTSTGSSIPKLSTH